MTHELAAPGNHQTLIAERAIQTWKAHMVSNLNRVDEKFPISCWCQIVNQTELTLNLLWQSNIVPNISAYAHVHGQHDYMRNPFAPIGCRVEVHIKPDYQRDVGNALPHQWNTTSVTKSMYQELEQLESAIRSISNTNTLPTCQYHLNHTS